MRTGIPPHLRTIARAELRHGWRQLLLIGLLAAVVGTTTVAATALARRTGTSLSRLEEATGADDARGLVFGHDDLVDEVIGLPEVEQSWTGRVGFAQVEDSFVFLGITAGPDRPSALLDPIVLEGRLPGGAEGSFIEVALRDDFQREVGIPIGTELPVRFLTEADYFRFDTGFDGGRPNGPELTLRVVGTIRLSGPSGLPAIAAPEALRQHPDAFSPGAAWSVTLTDGASSLSRFRSGVRDLTADRELPEEATEFEVTSVEDTADARASVQHSADLLSTALLVLAGSVGIVGLVAVAQAVARHRAAAEREQEILRAMGVTVGERRLAAAMAAAAAALLAGSAVVVGALATAGIEPIGALRNYEPAPGRSLNVGVTAVGAGLTVAVVLLAAVTTTRRRLTARPLIAPRESRIVARVARLGGGPSTASGLRFALEPGQGARAVPVRSAVTAGAIGVAAAVAGAVFVGSLDRLVDEPARAGIPFDVLVSNTDDALVDALLDELGVETVTAVSTAPLLIEGRRIDGYALTAARNQLEIDLVTGRLPRTPDEVTLGLRIADDTGAGPGDTVTAVDRAGRSRELAVVGTAVVPAFSSGQLGLNALLTSEGLSALGRSTPYASAAISVTPGANRVEVAERLAERVEAGVAGLPPEVANVRELGRLPGIVSALLALIGLVALVNALVMLVRRRGADLALLRSIGLRRRDIRTVVVVMAVTIAWLGAIVGVPLGLAAGSLLWRITAQGAYVAPDALVLWWVPVGVVVASVGVAALAALLPARRAGRVSPAQLLHEA